MAYKSSRSKCWVADYTIEKVDGTKERKRKFGFKTKRDAQDYEVKHSDIEVFIDAPLFGDLFDEFLENKKNVVRNSTLRRNKSVIENHLRPALNDFEVDKLNNRLVIKFRNELLDKGLSNSRINNCIALLKETYNYAKPIYGLTADPFINIKKLRVKTSNIDFFTLEEFKKFISKVDDIVYNAFFKVLYYCGLRKGEALTLNWQDIDFRNRKISINKSVTQKVKGLRYFIDEPKNASSNRTVSMDKNTIESLKELKTLQKENYPNFSNTFFVFSVDNPLSETTITNKFEKYCKEAGVKRIRIHDLRHSHASLLINNGASPVLVAKRLGHNDIRMTLNTYSHLYQEKEDTIIDIINELE
ncbi:MAG: site-specific integrase [Bacilli bacterium]|nr:site-specific integrase [Bacilli bacterium]